MSRLVWMLMLAGFVAVVGCERKPVEKPPGTLSTEDVRRDAGQAVNTAVEFSQQAREEFQKNLAARLKTMDTEIAQLQAKGRELKGEAKIKWDQKLVDLKTKRDSARVKLAEIGTASAEAWKDVQQGAQSAWDEMDKAVRDAWQDF